MVDYPYDDAQDFIDRETFDVLGKYFSLIKEYKERRGVNIFKFDLGTLLEMNTTDLVRLSPYLFAFGHSVFTRGKQDYDNKRVIELLQNRGVNTQSYLDALIDAEFAGLGPESIQHIADIAMDLDRNKTRDYGFDTDRLNGWIKHSKERVQHHQTILDKYNEGRMPPFTLEKVLNFEEEPVTLRYTKDGSLYVLDIKGNLHEFVSGFKTREWNLLLENGLNMNGMITGGVTTYPNIAVEGNLLFLTDGYGNLTRHELRRREALGERVSLVSYVATQDVPRGRRYFHQDVLIQEGNVLVSVSQGDGSRSIVQVTPSDAKIVYSGRYPVHSLRNNMEDHTLRLGLHKGFLYFPEEHGLRRFDPQGSVEMVGEYVKQAVDYGTMDPITKFSFGDHFMIAYVSLKDARLPMMGIFRPVYDQEGMVSSGGFIPPTRFSLEYVGYPPKAVGRTITDASVSAHSNQFAVTHSVFKKVFVYRVNE